MDDVELASEGANWYKFCLLCLLNSSWLGFFWRFSKCESLLEKVKWSQWSSLMIEPPKKFFLEVVWNWTIYMSASLGRPDDFNFFADVSSEKSKKSSKHKGIVLIPTWLDFSTTEMKSEKSLILFWLSSFALNCSMHWVSSHECMTWGRIFSRAGNELGASKARGIRENH